MEEGEDQRHDVIVRRLDPAAPLLSELGEREPVNPPTPATSLERRIAEDRRVFVIQHPARPEAVLSVVWVALTHGVPARLDDVLRTDLPVLDPLAADTAVFHSIWKVQERRAGRGSGRDLIEGAADALRAELPNLRTFVTLSPVPGLRAWVEATGSRHVPGGAELAVLGARYLTTLDEVGRPIDPVARFHLSNGARLWRVNPAGDPSALGVERSFGLLANYRYLPEDRAANRNLLADGTVPVGEQVTVVLDSPGPDDDHHA